MLKDRAKRKVKSKAKSKAKSKIRGEIREEGGPKVLKAAAVGGTAYYAGKKISEKRQEDQASQQGVTYESAPVPASTDDTISQLERLGVLKSQGIITDEEFQAQKAKILGT